MVIWRGLGVDALLRVMEMLAGADPPPARKVEGRRAAAPCPDGSLRKEH